MSLSNNPGVLNASAPVAVVTPSSIQQSGVNSVVAGYGAGTDYTLTTTSAAITFGTSSPQVTLPAAGTYFITGAIQLNAVNANANTQNVILKVRRTNNTPADLPNALITIDLPLMTGASQTLNAPNPRGVIYAGAAGDVLALFGNLSAALGAGSIRAMANGTVLSRLAALLTRSSHAL